MSFHIVHNEKGNYPCKVKGCRFKKRNGRCSLEHITFLDDGLCISFRTRV